MICSITSLYVVYFSYRFLFLDKFHGFVCITHRYFNDITTFRQIGYIYRGFFCNFNQFTSQKRMDKPSRMRYIIYRQENILCFR